MRMATRCSNVVVQSWRIGYGRNVGGTSGAESGSVRAVGFGHARSAHGPERVGKVQFLISLLSNPLKIDYLPLHNGPIVPRVYGP